MSANNGGSCAPDEMSYVNPAALGADRLRTVGGNSLVRLNCTSADGDGKRGVLWTPNNNTRAHTRTGMNNGLHSEEICEQKTVARLFLSHTKQYRSKAVPLVVTQ